MTGPMPDNPISVSGMSTEKVAGVLVIGALVFLIAVRRGFSGVSVGEVTGGIIRS